MKITGFSLHRTMSGMPWKYVRGMTLILFIFSLSFSAQPLMVTQTLAAQQEALGVRGDFDVVSGYIQEVINDNIKVEDRYYNIASVPLKNAKGRVISKAVLTNGAKVEIRHKNGVVKGITFIHGYSYE
jgi:hypothetical protein